MQVNAKKFPLPDEMSYFLHLLAAVQRTGKYCFKNLHDVTLTFPAHMGPYMPKTWTTSENDPPELHYLSTAKYHKVNSRSACKRGRGAARRG